MTIHEAIELADALKPNSYPRALKIAWLSKLDRQVFIELFSNHADCPEGGFAGYGGETPQDTPLLIPAPYGEDVYSFFLQSSIDRENGESSKYNRSAALFNGAYAEFRNFYNRTHLPVQAGTFRF